MTCFLWYFFHKKFKSWRLPSCVKPETYMSVVTFKTWYTFPYAWILDQIFIYFKQILTRILSIVLSWLWFLQSKTFNRKTALQRYFVLVMMRIKESKISSRDMSLRRFAIFMFIPRNVHNNTLFSWDNWLHFVMSNRPTSRSTY